jgi:perosamine synthetase
VSQKKNIPWASPSYWGHEREYVSDALQSTWISGGKYVDRLEADLAKYCGIPYVVSASNGTTALHMAFLAMGVDRDDEVVVPGFAFMAAANVALHMGARPVFTEVDPNGWCMTADNVERSLSSRTKVIVPVHTYGNVCDMDPIKQLADKHRVAVVEDAAEALGSRYKGRMAGTIAPVGVLSFQATKTITTGEGGAVVTRDEKLRDRMRLFRNHGMDVRRYWHEVAGHNFRLTNLLAALGCAQLEQIDRIVAERGRMYQAYRKCLESCPGATLQEFPPNIEAVVWAISLKLDPSAFPQGRDSVIAQLRERGIETRPGFYSAGMMHHLYGTTRLPICDDLSRQVLSLPSSPTLTGEEIEYVCASLDALRR